MEFDFGEPGGGCRGLVVLQEVHEVSLVPPTMPSENTDGMENMVHEDKFLGTHIEDSILRGVSSAHVLRNFGAAFRERGFIQEDYLLSQPTEHLDDFISHDWASARLGKALALCLIYNGWAAAVASLAAGVALGLLQSRYARVLPVPEPRKALDAADFSAHMGVWAQLLCPAVFVFFFLFWQDVRAFLRLRTRLVFLDKFCIDQQHAQRKSAGVLGLGGFLRHTERFVICWTPRYFTRLWCAYEVAAWLHLKKSMHTIEFLPLSHAKALAVGGISMCGMTWCLGVILSLFGPRAILMADIVAFFVPTSIAMHMNRRLVRQVRELPAQLQGFTVGAADCFCCSNAHTLPGGPRGTIPCDRELVLRTLAAWYKDEESDDGVPQAKKFDEHIRSTLGPWVLEHAGPTQLPYKYIVLCGWPWIWRSCDLLATLGAIPTRLFMNWLPVDVQVGLVVVPVTYKLSLLVASWFDARWGVQESPCCDVLLTVVLTCVVFLGAFVVCAPMSVVAERQALPLHLVCIAVNLGIALAVFCPACVRLRRGLERSAAACTFWRPAFAPPGVEQSPPAPVAPKVASAVVRDDVN